MRFHENRVHVQLDRSGIYNLLPRYFSVYAYIGHRYWKSDFRPSPRIDFISPKNRARLETTSCPGRSRTGCFESREYRPYTIRTWKNLWTKFLLRTVTEGSYLLLFSHNALIIKTKFHHILFCSFLCFRTGLVSIA